MPLAIAALLFCQLIGEALHAALNLPLPGPVIGMVLLTMVLVVRGRDPARDAAPPALVGASEGLINNMGLLFVPAGVGVITLAGPLSHAWLPIVAGVVVSTMLSLIVTGLVMHHVSRTIEARQPGPERGDAQ